MVRDRKAATQSLELGCSEMCGFCLVLGCWVRAPGISPRFGENAPLSALPPPPHPVQALGTGRDSSGRWWWGQGPHRVPTEPQAPSSSWPETQDLPPPEPSRQPREGQRQGGVAPGASSGPGPSPAGPHHAHTIPLQGAARPPSPTPSPRLAWRTPSRPPAARGT